MINKRINFDYTGLKAYAGYYLNKDRILKSASGGVASAISEMFISEGGVVFGVGYSAGYKSAEYYVAYTLEELEVLKGSKYINSRKKLLFRGEYQLVYKAVEICLLEGRKVLFTGLGCDIGALKYYCEKKQINMENLYTLELICVGTTIEAVLETFVKELEVKFQSSVTDFTVRYKKEGWQIPFLHVEFSNGVVFEGPFNESDIGAAFNTFIRKCCINCVYKGEKHKGDLAVGDYYRMEKELEYYNQDGVSIIITKTEKGEELVNRLSAKEFYFKEVAIEKALIENPKYYERAEENVLRYKFLTEMKKYGLRYSVSHCYPNPLQEDVKYQLILWGTGTFYQRYVSLVQYITDVSYVCDNNASNWGKAMYGGVKCISPEQLMKLQNVFVVLMVGDEEMRKEIEQQLISMGIEKFDYVLNWFKYATEERFGKLV